MSRSKAADPAEEELADSATPGPEPQIEAASGPEDVAEPAGLELAGGETESPEQQLEAAGHENAQLRDRLLRQAADFENYRKRVARDQEQAAIEARIGVIERLLPILDNLERALGADAPPESLREGVILIQKELLGALEAESVSAEHPVGGRFDPERHQALVHEPAPGHAEGTIVEVFRKGYVLGDRLLRPTLVKVAKGDDEAPEQTQTPEHVH